MKPVATYSIVAVDPVTKDVGIGVQSRFLAVGAIVPWLEAGVGAVATQAWANTGYGPQGLQGLRNNEAPETVIQKITAADEGRDRRQVGIVSVSGQAAAFTGSACADWAGHVCGEGFTCQGNILTSGQVVHDMADAFQSTKGDLSQRLLAALDAGQAAGGDSRGMQSAALAVARSQGGYGGFNDRFVDLRVDDHANPLQELRRLFTIHKLYFYPTDPTQRIPLEAAEVKNLQRILSALGMYSGSIHGNLDEDTRCSLDQFMHKENFEGRIQQGPWMDGEVYEYMLNRWKISG